MFFAHSYQTSVNVMQSNCLPKWQTIVRPLAVLRALVSMMLFQPNISFAMTCRSVFSDNLVLRDRVADTLFAVSHNSLKAFKTLDLIDCGPSCIELPSLSNLKFQIRVDSKVSEPLLELSPTGKTLRVADPLVLAEEKHFDLFRQFLVGHVLHPYSGVGPKRFKPAQALALRAFYEAMNSGSKSFLHVAPTGTGKATNLVKALSLKIAKPGAKKISIVTVDKIDLVEQLYQDIKRQNHSAELINMNHISNRDFEWLINRALGLNTPTVLTLTTQSLKSIYLSLSSKAKENLRDQLDGLYLDEAHHLGAPQTSAVLSELVDQPHTLLYAATATPVHASVSLQGLFDKVHWSYLHTKDNLFGTYPVERVMDQLRMAIKKGDVTHFDELYIIGEPNFFNTTKEPLLITGESHFLVINPYHYQRLAQMIAPIIGSNKKGFIATATIAEAERLAQYLSNTFKGISFEPYHSELSRPQRQEILQRSDSLESHYLVTVRALDEGINLPQLSSYIDLNSNVSVKQMIHRVGRVLRIHPSKMSADILYLVNYKNEEMVRDLLSLLEVSQFYSISNTRRIEESGDAHFSAPTAQGLSRLELQTARELLEQSLRNFWATPQSRWLPYDEAKALVQSSGVRTFAQYNLYSKEGRWPEGMPSAPNVTYKSNWVGWGDFLGTGRRVRPKTPFLPYSQARQLVQVSGITTAAQYKRYSKDGRLPEGLPSTPDKNYKDDWAGWGHFLGTGRKSTKEFLSYSEAKTRVQMLGLKTKAQYLEYRKAEGALDGLPSTPHETYKENWVSWSEFLNPAP